MVTKIYSEKEFMELIDKKQYQAFLFSSRVPFPFCFARHSWIVLNNKGKLNRWDIFYVKNKKGNYVWNTHKNFSRAINKYLWKMHPRWKESILLGEVSGKKAERLIAFMKDVDKKYPFSNKYGYYRVPNCNTFIKWILDNNKYLEWKLNWRFFGRKYKKLL